MTPWLQSLLGLAAPLLADPWLWVKVVGAVLLWLVGDGRERKG
jgi:hypothetical protein